jgi:glyoxylase-like metal-dependent hydrolase (beta-lactamase superfamily II)
LKYVLLTHAHPDHAGACTYLQDRYGAKIACSEYEGRVLRQGACEFFQLDGSEEAVGQWRDMPKCEPDYIIKDGELIDLGDIRIEAILTPGHTAGSVSYMTDISGKRGLFSGDTVFYKGFISLLSPPFSSYDLYRQGLEKLADKHVDGLFPSHLLWVLEGGQEHIDTARRSFLNYQLPKIKPFS